MLASDAVTQLHEAVEGCLRDIGRLTTAALQDAATRKLSIVDRAIFEDVLERDEAMP